MRVPLGLWCISICVNDTRPTFGLFLGWTCFPYVFHMVGDSLWSVMLHSVRLSPPEGMEQGCLAVKAPTWLNAASRYHAESANSGLITVEYHYNMVQYNTIAYCTAVTFKELNSLWPSDAIQRRRSWSTSSQVMACCLTAPNHYLNQCWLINSKVQWH